METQQSGMDVTCERDEIRESGDDKDTDVWAPCPCHSGIGIWVLTQSDREGD